jgi:hypothetical protein
MAQGCQLQLHRQFHCLLEAILEQPAVDFAEIAQHAEIRAVHVGDEPEGQVFTATALDLPGAEDTPTVGVDQDGNDLFGMIGVLALGALQVFNASGIQLREECGVQIAFMILRQQSEDIAGK